MQCPPLVEHQNSQGRRPPAVQVGRAAGRRVLSLVVGVIARLPASAEARSLLWHRNACKRSPFRRDPPLDVRSPDHCIWRITGRSRTTPCPMRSQSCRPIGHSLHSMTLRAVAPLATPYTP